MLKRNSYSCNEHIDIAIDDFILATETFPLMDELDGKVKCDYCTNRANYILKTSDTNEDF